MPDPEVESTPEPEFTQYPLAPEGIGAPSVDTHLRALDDLAQTDLAEHAGLYEALHSALEKHLNDEPTPNPGEH
ncbi:hypothetical protein ACQR35_12755 [Pseudarthrobacter sp. J1738]|uniref:hypothetical protein n=1 Tax=Pseudarthrobacter sp. J1738 TaxID=3420446 RepID=UPI003D295203